MRARLHSIIDTPRTWQLVLGVGITLSALRGLRFAHPYARAHWLFHYGHGFVKRGLPGQALRPLLLGKGPSEVRIIVDWVTALLAFGTASALVAFSVHALARVEPRSRHFGVVALSASLLVVSPFVVSLANLSGYFDQLLVLASLAAALLVMRGQHGWAGVVGALAALTHEMFALFGLPLVAFACWLVAPQEPRRSLSSAIALGPPALALLAVALSERLGGSAAAGLSAELESGRSLDRAWATWAAHPLRHSAGENLVQQAPRFLDWLGEPVALTALHPTTLVLGALTLYALALALPGQQHARRRRVGMALASVVVLAPMGIALLGWDWPRFFVMAQFHAFTLTLLVSSWAPQREGAPPEPAARTYAPTRWPLPLLGALALVVTLVSLNTSLPRVAGADEDERPFALRMRSHFTCTGLLFRNASFGRAVLSPWVVTDEGGAFRGQPLRGDLPARRGASPARPFHDWIGTAERSGERALGTLVSPPFVLQQDLIAFRLGGSASPDVFVRLLVDGAEAQRATPGGGEELRTVRWDVSRLRGRSATIELADHSPSAHLNVEGFCYAR